MKNGRELDVDKDLEFDRVYRNPGAYFIYITTTNDVILQKWRCIFLFTRRSKYGEKLTIMGKEGNYRNRGLFLFSWDSFNQRMVFIWTKKTDLVLYIPIPPSYHRIWHDEEIHIRMIDRTDTHDRLSVASGADGTFVTYDIHGQRPFVIHTPKR
jgi:hypothetical protein